MNQEEQIHIDEDTEAHQGKQNGREWTEEFRVAGEELMDTMQRLFREANVRRVVVRNNEGRTLIEVPLWMGLGGVALMGVWSALALMAAMVADYSILVVRSEKEPEQPSTA